MELQPDQFNGLIGNLAGDFLKQKLGGGAGGDLLGGLAGNLLSGGGNSGFGGANSGGGS